MLATRYIFEKTLAAFETGGQPPASGEDGRAVLAVLAACYHSAKMGRRLRMDDPEVTQLRTIQMGAASSHA